jgi:hypothetical protein
VLSFDWLRGVDRVLASVINPKDIKSCILD